MSIDQELVNAIVARGRTEIVRDIARGTVPPTVTSFAELHDYVDANCYGGLCDDDAPDPELGYGNPVQNALDAWLRLRFRTSESDVVSSLAEMIEANAEDEYTLEVLSGDVRPGSRFNVGGGASGDGWFEAVASERRYLTVRFDVTGWTDAEVDALAGEVLVQGERSDEHPDANNAEVI